jgi:hypothetical protein
MFALQKENRKKEKSKKHIGLTQQNVFGPAFSQRPVTDALVTPAVG